MSTKGFKKKGLALLVFGLLTGLVPILPEVSLSTYAAEPDPEKEETLNTLSDKGNPTITVNLLDQFGKPNTGWNDSLQKKTLDTKKTVIF